MQYDIPIRFWIGCMIFLTAYINYTTRVNMSISIVAMTAKSNAFVPECKKDEMTVEDALKRVNTTDYGPRYSWDEHIQATILGSYFWGYIITSLPGGLLAEYLGPVRTIFWAHAFTTLVNIGCIFSPRYHWGLVAFCRFFIGLCAGPIFPALQCLIGRWAPPMEKKKFIGALLGNAFGTFVTWPVVGAITESFGWDWGFYAISIQMALFLIIFWIVTTDSPADHRWISEVERNFILGYQGATSTRAIPPYCSIFTSLPVWALQVLHFGNLWGLYFQLTGIPKFMTETVGFDITMAGLYGALPHLLRMILGMGFGSLNPCLKAIRMTDKVTRKVFVIFSHIIPGILMIGVGFVSCSAVPIVILLTLSLGINGAVILTDVLNPHDLSPNFVSTIYGIMSFTGGMTGFLVPHVTGVLIFENNGVDEWSWNFIISGIVYIVSGILFVIFGKVRIQKWNFVGRDDAEGQTS